jgi:hypothetical protein
VPLTAWQGSLAAGIRPLVGNPFGSTPHPGNVYRVGGRTMARRKLAISRAQETRTLAFVLAASLAPALLFMIGIAATLQDDLSDLAPIRGTEKGATLLNWSSLLREDHAEADTRSALRTGMEVRALGYMVDGGRVPRDGEPVREFYLLPDAGHLFHPAHRHGDQMIAVHLDDGVRVRFSSRSLVWVWGSLRILQGDADGPKPLYALERAHAQPADKGDVRRYFQ